MNKTVIYTTISFIVMTLPNAVVSFLYPTLAQYSLGLLIIRLGDLFSFSFHGFNFFINFAFNKKFRHQFRNLLKSFPNT